LAYLPFRLMLHILTVHGRDNCGSEQPPETIVGRLQRKLSLILCNLTRTAGVELAGLA
jgi:hypothetical protein